MQEARVEGLARISVYVSRNREKQSSLFYTDFPLVRSIADLCIAHKPFTMSYLTNKSVPAVAKQVKRGAINMRFNALSFIGQTLSTVDAAFVTSYFWKSSIFSMVRKTIRRL